MKKLNAEEILYGAVFGGSMVYWTLGYAFLVAPVCGVLWALSGRDESTKLWRRLGCPAVQAAALYLVTKSIWVIGAIPIGYGILSLGYGVPSTQPPDSGSALGRFFYEKTKGNELLANLGVRGFIMGLLFLDFAIFAVIGSLIGK